jgi:hypothetical protein
VYCFVLIFYNKILRNICQICVLVVVWDCSHTEFAHLQNIHLVKKWLPALEKKLECYSQGSHSDYRIFLSAEPAATPAAHIIPQVRSLSVMGRTV